MRRIYKYPIPINSTNFSIEMPMYSKILRVDWQNGGLFLWALVDPSNSPSRRVFQCFGTGQDIADGLEYLKTYEIGPLVIHLFVKGGL